MQPQFEKDKDEKRELLDLETEHSFKTVANFDGIANCDSKNPSSEVRLPEFESRLYHLKYL